MTLPASTSTEPGLPRGKTRRRWLQYAGPIVGVCVITAVAWVGDAHIVSILGFAAIYGIFCTGLNLFMGYTGQASFGQNAFAALGAYGTAIFCDRVGLEPIVALVASMAVSALVALIVGYPTLRLRGHYLAMATFALGLIAYELSVQWSGLTQGYMGYSGIPPMGIGRFRLATDRQQLAMLVVLLGLGMWVASRLSKSRFGRALRAISGSEPAARALAIDVPRYKLAVFVIAAAYASAAGSLFAHFVGFISPEVFGLSMIIQSFTMLYLGGIGTIWGPVIGAFVISFLPELFRGLKDLQDFAYCIVLIIMLIYLPKGLASLPSLIGAQRGADRP